MNLIELQDELDRVVGGFDLSLTDLQIKIEIPVRVKTKRISIFKRVEEIAPTHAGFEISKIFYDVKSGQLVIKGE